MSGFLSHLIQRTLAAPRGIRPRPVSLFESPQPPLGSETQLAKTYEADVGTTAREPVRMAQRFDSFPPMIHGEEIQPVLDDPDSAREKSEGGHETFLRSDASLPLYEELRRRKARQARSPESSQQSALLNDSLVETDVGDVSGQRPFQVVPPLAREQPNTQSSEVQRYRLRLRTKKDAPDRSEDLRSLQVVSDPSTTGEHAERETVAAAETIRQPRIHVRAKLVAQPHVQNAETSLQASSPPSEVFSTPVNPARGETRQPLDQRTVAEPERPPAPSPQPLSRNTRSEESAASSQAVLLPRLPRFEPITQPMEPQKERSPAPTVHVTIGRVEIRAVSAPAAQKRSSPMKPALSLSDYLTRRNGGRG